MSDQKPRTYPIATAKLAVELERQLSQRTLLDLYDTLRQSVYGIPGGAVPAQELVHFLAELNAWKEPSE